MKISHNNINFNGYDARPLKAVCMTHVKNGIANELDVIGKKVGFDVFVVSSKKIIPAENLKDSKIDPILNSWAQDYTVLTPKKNLRANKFIENYTNLLQRQFPDYNYSFEHNILPAGGNIYFIQNSDGSQKMLAGKNDYPIINNDAKIFDVDKIDYVPQLDFHIDMFLRPLDNNRILLTDDDMTIDIIKNAIKKFDKYGKSKFYTLSGIKALTVKSNLQTLLNNFEEALSKYTYKNTKSSEVKKCLEEKGYDVISVPGRLIVEPPYKKNKIDKKANLFNYMNAIVTKDKNNDLVYITNKSLLDEELGISKELAKKVGFSFEDAFINSIAPIINKENIYFISGENNALSSILKIYSGGIHCMITEFPLEKN